jgi:hypothetical protein
MRVAEAAIELDDLLEALFREDKVRPLRSCRRDIPTVHPWTLCVVSCGAGTGWRRTQLDHESTQAVALNVGPRCQKWFWREDARNGTAVYKGTKGENETRDNRIICPARRGRAGNGQTTYNFPNNPHANVDFIDYGTYANLFDADIPVTINGQWKNCSVNSNRAIRVRRGS